MTQTEFDAIWHNDDDFVVCHTSGSTGRPKEIQLKKEFMRRSAERTVAFFNIDSDSRLHTCLDFKFIASKMMTVRAEVANCCLTSEPPTSTPLRGIGKAERIDLLSVVPAQMAGILNESSGWTGIRHFLIGGSAIPPLLRRRIVLSDYDAWESYGMTETASHIALRKVEETGREPFKTLAGITVGQSKDGCLKVKLPGCKIIKTNDLAEILSDTEFRILGRADNCIISGGIKIIPEDLESLLGPFIAFEYVLSSVPDEKWGERLVLVVEAPREYFDLEFLKKSLMVRLNMFRKSLDLGPKSPKDIIFVDSLPRTQNGKIHRGALKKQLLS